MDPGSLFHFLYHQVRKARFTGRGTRISHCEKKLASKYGSISFIFRDITTADNGDRRTDVRRHRIRRTNSKAKYSTFHFLCCCDYADAEAECLTNRVGRGYLGKVQNSSSGRKCEHWSKTPDSLGIKLQDINIEDAQNYCMYIPGSNWAHPSCVVSTSSGRMRIEPCNIEYCGGEHHAVTQLLSAQSK